MPILNFPNNPSVGDTYTGDNGISYIWDGNKWGGHTAAIDTINTNSSYLINNGNIIQVDGAGNLVMPVGASVIDADGNPISTGGGGLSITDFGIGFVNNLDNGKITTSKLYNENPNPGLNNQYELSVDNGGVVHLPDQSVINGATLKTVPGNYAGITAGPQGADEDSWVWVDNSGATISTKYSTDAHTWTFDNNGRLTFPQGTTIATADGTDAFIIDGAVGKDVQIYTYGNDVPNGWTFGTDGNLTLPAGGSIYGLSIIGGEGTNVQADQTTEQVYISSYNTSSFTSSVWTFSNTGTLTIPGDIQDDNGSVIRVASTSTAPTRVNGQLWYNSEEGRTYIKYNDQWVDANPVVVPSPGTYLDEITIDGSTLNINGSTLTISNTGTLLVNGSEVTGSGGSGDSINNGPYSVSIDEIGAVTMATGRGTVLFGNIPEVGPTGSTHFHIMKDSPSTVDLFFGDDYNYVKLPTTLGVEIGAQGNVWQFSTTGTLTLPNGGTITEGAGPFTGAIRLEPSGASSSTQALVIYPTAGGDGNHIHLTAGGGSTDLYLGNDQQYVKVDHSGTVVVGTVGINTSTWTFGIDGVLTLPAATPVIKGGGTGTDVTIVASTGSNTSTWTFGADGGLTFPDSTVQTTAWLGGNASSLATTANSSNNFNIGNFINSATLDINYTAFTGDYGIDFDISYQAPLDGTKGVTVGAVETPRILSTGSVILKTDISSSTSTWTFGQDGDLTIPGNIHKETAASIVVGSNYSPITNVAISTIDYDAPVWRMFVSANAYPNLGIDATAGDTITTSWGTPVTATIQQVIDDRVGSSQWVFTVDQNVATGFTGPGATTTFNSVSKTWTFGKDSNLTLPGDLVTPGNIQVGTTATRAQVTIVGNSTATLGMYNTTGDVGAQIYLGDQNFNSSTKWNSAPGVGATYDNNFGGLAGALGLYTYAGNDNSRSLQVTVRANSLGVRIHSTSTADGSLTAGALVVEGGATIAKDLYVNGGIISNNQTIKFSSTTTDYVTYTITNNLIQIGNISNPAVNWNILSDNWSNGAIDTRLVVPTSSANTNTYINFSSPSNNTVLQSSDLINQTSGGRPGFSVISSNAINLVTNPGGGYYGTGIGYAWAFDNAGCLTFPNGPKISIPSGTPRTGAIAITSSTELLIGTNTTTTNNLWTFGIDGSTILPENTLKGYCFTATNSVFNYLPQSAQFMYTDSPILSLISTIGGSWYIKGPGLVGWKPVTAVQDNSGVALIVRIGSGAGPMGDGSEFHSGGYLPTSPDLVYTISQYLDFDLKAADKTWTFSENGGLTFPNNTVQTTAYKSTSGSWTLATGSNTVSITVPPNGNYQMWVNGNIPNGIVEWNATVNVSNTNVPVIGSQYAWYYALGNALVLTAIPDQIVGTVGVISTSNSYVGNTANVFTFGITNNSTSTRTVNWGYTTL
jgi:hypothetical protein